MLGASFTGLAGTIGVMVSMPLLMVTPHDNAAEFLDRLEGWIDEHEAHVEELNSELDRLDSWKEGQLRGEHSLT